MGYMKLCGQFHITAEPGQGPTPYNPHCFDPGPCFCLSPDSAQCEYNIRLENEKAFSSKGILKRLEKSWKITQNTGNFGHIYEFYSGI